MQRLIVLSGKGGTGKTTVAGALIRLSKARAYADCDVDAPNLHLSLRQTARPESEAYFGMPKARIDGAVCTSCGQCLAHCRFEAVVLKDGAVQIDPLACEGCGVCAAVCPAGAVAMEAFEAGETLLYKDENAVFSTATLHTGGGATGKLVTQVKRRLFEAAPPGEELAILDGSPGIGCPVIASISGASMALLVAEPSVSGLSDLKRILRTAEQFRTPVAVCVNKADANAAITQEIRHFCEERNIAYIGEIPFDPEAARLINGGRTIADEDCPSGRAVRRIYFEVMRLLSRRPEE